MRASWRLIPDFERDRHTEGAYSTLEPKMFAQGCNKFLSRFPGNINAGFAVALPIIRGMFDKFKAGRPGAVLINNGLKEESPAYLNFLLYHFISPLGSNNSFQARRFARPEFRR